MTWNCTPPEIPATLIGRFAFITRSLTDTVYACSMPGGFLSHAMYSVLQAWIFGHVVRIRVLIAALQAGTVRTRTSRVTGLPRTSAGIAGRAAAAASAFVVPRRFAWLLTMMRSRSQNASMPNGALESLLSDPETLGLLAASPRLVRTMRPLCRALGVRMPLLPAPAPPAPPASAMALPEGGAATGCVRPVGVGPVGAGPGGLETRGSLAPLANRRAARRTVARFAGGDPRFRK